MQEPVGAKFDAFNIALFRRTKHPAFDKKMEINFINFE